MKHFEVRLVVTSVSWHAADCASFARPDEPIAAVSGGEDGRAEGQSSRGRHAESKGSFVNFFGAFTRRDETSLVPLDQLTVHKDEFSRLETTSSTKIAQLEAALELEARRTSGWAHFLSHRLTSVCAATVLALQTERVRAAGGGSGQRSASNGRGAIWQKRLDPGGHDHLWRHPDDHQAKGTTATSTLR